MRNNTLKIFPVNTLADIKIVKMLFVEYVEFLKDVLCEYADLPWLIQYYLDFKKEVDNLHSRYKPPEGAILLAGHDNQPAGCVAFGKLSDSICEMKRLFIRPGYRRKGVGTALCEALMERAHKMGYTYMRLTTVLKDAKTFYDSLGFKKVAPYRGIPGEFKNVFYMELKLA